MSRRRPGVVQFENTLNGNVNEEKVGLADLVDPDPEDFAMDAGFEVHDVSSILPSLHLSNASYAGTIK